MRIPSLVIGHLVAQVPLIQGGMGIGVSGPRLAAAVAREKGIGMLSGAQIGYQEPDFKQDPLAANLRALKAQIKEAKENSQGGIVGINLMVAMNHYEKLVQAAVEAGADLILSGAGLPSDLPALTAGSQTKIGPIVSSAKGARVLARLWDQRYGHPPDVVVVEGPEAGGHLGFSLDQLQAEPGLSLEEIVAEVVAVLKPFEEKAGRPIPVVGAGGVYSGQDIARLLNRGAAGVQMATRFVATEECDASEAYKAAYLKATQEDICLVKSPVGMPGRAIRNPFLKRLEQGRIPVKGCYNCLRPCDPGTTAYCISQALMEAVRGNVEDGLIFTGSNAYRLDRILTVKELIAELMTEAEQYMQEIKEGKEDT